MSKDQYSVQAVHETLLDTFHQYLSAQYHIWDEGLISERDRILREVGNTFQEPRLEATPQYKSGNNYSDLSIPMEAKEILKIASNNYKTGIPKVAYSHQCHALESYFEGNNLIVATGTGSGKTESFLMPIISNLVIEAKRKTKTWQMPAVRALLLYPMNALVNDQLGRLRRLLGDKDIQESICGANQRSPKFGMYTSRTPYAGQRSKKKDNDRVQKEIKKLYFDEMTDAYKNILKSEGKWPAKNLQNFIDNGLKTDLFDDAELVTRHEMQDWAPDLLITNYSMLEYMMLRPIEATIFESTAKWLNEDESNYFTIVLDEAHMYRGSGGAEVAYLLRRLQSRLGITRDRIRFILTSASLGSSEQAKDEIKEFAAKLTGGVASTFEIITGTLNRRDGGAPASQVIQKALVEFDYAPLLGTSESLIKAKLHLTTFASNVGLKLKEPKPERESLQQFAYELLEMLPVAALVAEKLMSSPETLITCSSIAFPDKDKSEIAAESLLALMTFAREQESGRPFCPIRAHFFFRGLPGLYACTNVECLKSKPDTAPSLLGRLHPNETLRCNCGARVYELLTHRSCGAAYLRAYIKGADGDFLWHQPSSGAWTKNELIEAQFYVVPRSEVANSRGLIVWLHILTGQLLPSLPKEAIDSHYLPLIRPDGATRERGRVVLSLKSNCPACNQRPRSELPIAMDLATKGEAPFAHLVRAQVATQPVTRLPTPQAPNGGRKTILFSDGRQKAARLARDIPREIELDVFRQTLFLAAKNLSDIGKEAKLDETLYTAFIDCLQKSNIRFFDGADRQHIENDLSKFSSFYDNDLKLALDEKFTPPPSFWVILLKQLGAPYYSISALTLGFVEPTNAARSRILRELDNLPSSDVDALVTLWIQRLLSMYAIGKDLPTGVKNKASRYPISETKAINGFTKQQREFFKKEGLDADRISSCFASSLCDTSSGDAVFLSPRYLKIKSAFNEEWIQCKSCKTITPSLIMQRCSNCWSQTTSLVHPDNTSYLRARKGFWRDPVVKAMSGVLPPMSIDVQEHSAQLSYKDTDSPSPTSEVFERQFRDILKLKERAVDVLSCTTTMEVGIDIGSLIAVAMRNVPPMRQNYQQRAGRAGRRGSSVSNVFTYAQSGAHDAYYFLNPDKILAGDPPKPVLDTSNKRIAERHVFAQLLQDFFRPLTVVSTNIYTALGDTWNFYTCAGPASFASFKIWLVEKDGGIKSLARAQSWVPQGLAVNEVAESMINSLEKLKPNTSDGLEPSLLEFLFAKGLLPSYAFPTDICALQIQEKIHGGKLRVVEKPQQSLNVALSEYAPGRLVVVNKKTYRIGTVAASSADTEVDRAKALFDRSKVYQNCTNCTYTAGFIRNDSGEKRCPQCKIESLRSITVIRPETVFPSGRSEIDEFDDEQVFSQVSTAQLPLLEEDLTIEMIPFGMKGGLKPRQQQRLVVVNEGNKESGEVGFRICNKCGKVLEAGQKEGLHYRDYFYQINSTNAGQSRCDGDFKSVFLGYNFTSDILLFRVIISDPLRFGITSRRKRKPLEDALQTLCEALTLSIGRVLDVDTREVSAGYRFGHDGKSYFADIFIYDTLAGGAGYALQAGESFSEIFSHAKDLMSQCTCTESCENCLRHYANRFNHSILDRKLGFSLTQYIESGQVEHRFSHEEQCKILEPLVGMIHLSGGSVSYKNKQIKASIRGRDFVLAACPSLRSCEVKEYKENICVFTFTPYELARDLPSAFAELK